MTEDQKNELVNLGTECFGKLLNRNSYLSIDVNHKRVLVEDVDGFTQEYDLDSSDLHRAISNEKGDVKKYLIRIKQILF